MVATEEHIYGQKLQAARGIEPDPDPTDPYRNYWGDERPAPEPMEAIRAATGDLYRDFALSLGSDRDGARGAGVNLYGSPGSGIVPYMVPTLAFQSRKQTPSSAVKRNPMLFGPFWRIALRVGALPIKVFSIDATTGERQEATDHPAYQILRAPNPSLTRNLLISGTVLGVFIHRRIGWFKNRAGGKEPKELWPIPGNVLFPKRDPSSLISYFELRVPGYEPVRLKAEDVCYFRFMPDPDDWSEGVSPLGSLGAIGDYGSSALDASTEFFDNALLTRLWLDMKGKELSPAARMRLRLQLELARLDRWGIPVIEDGELKEMGKGPDPAILDAAIDRTGRLVKDTIGMPEVTQGERATGTEVMRMFYAEVVQPIADAMEQEFERSLMSEWPSRPAFPEFAFRETLKGTPAERITSHMQAILSMQETPNEARKDENRPGKPGGDQLFGPLNVVPIGTQEAVGETGVPPAADSKGGLGGDQGKGTLPSGQPDADQSQPVAVGAGKVEGAMRANRLTTTGRDGWGKQRTSRLNGQANGLGRRLRSLLKAELKALRAAIEPARTSPNGHKARAAETDLPALEDLLASIRANDPEVGRLVQAFMDQTGEDAWTDAEDLINAERTAVNEALAHAYATRAQAVESRFGGQRADALSKLFSEAIEFGWRPSDLAQAVNDAWGGMTSYLADGIARTETAWAYEQAAMGAWRESGVSQVEFVYGGGPCTTGVCEDAEGQSPYDIGAGMDNVGFSFEDADAPPLHPNCTCFTVAYIEDTTATSSPEGE